MKKKILLIIFLLVVLPIKINALTGSVNLKCNSTNVVVNTSTSCVLSGYSNEEVSALTAKLIASGNITITNISTASIWQGDGVNGLIDLYTDNNKKGSFSIATFNIKAGSTAGVGSVNVSSVNFSDAQFQEFYISNKTLNINVINQQSTSKPTNNITTKPTVNTQTNKATNNNQVDDKKSNDITLKSLVVKPININFNSNSFNYDIKVVYDVKTIDIKAEANNPNSKVTIPQNKTLNVGKNKFEIKVTAQDGSFKIYTINVIREEKNLSNNSKLKSIIIKNYKIDFDKTKFSYNLKNISEDFLDIEVIPEDSTATYKIYGNKNISSDDAIVIKVTAQDGSVSEYIIYANNPEKIQNSNFSMRTPLIYTIIILLVLAVFGLIVYKKRNK